MSSKPHVSQALYQLRSGVTLAVAVVGLCAMVQMLVFGFVHFTQVRWEHALPAVTEQSPTVVAANASAKVSKPAPVVSVEGAPKPGMILSRWDGALGFYSDAAVVIGIMGVFMMTIWTFQGTIVGAQVPGIEKGVSASTWSVALLMLTIPWREIWPNIPFGGVFGSYQSMTSASAAAQSGHIPLVALAAEYLVLPMTALAGSVLVLYRFRAGVERGFIITAPSELDQAVEREMRDIAKRGPGTAGVARAVGALNHAIGDKPEDPFMKQLLTPSTNGNRPPREPDTSRTRSWVSPNERPADGDDEPRRPI